MGPAHKSGVGACLSLNPPDMARRGASTNSQPTPPTFGARRTCARRDRVASGRASYVDAKLTGQGGFAGRNFRRPCRLIVAPVVPARNAERAVLPKFFSVPASNLAAVVE